MSDKIRGAYLPKTVASDCKKGVVKDLILEFEQLRVNCKTENIGMLRMGADQSSLARSQGNPRPATISTTSLVKQRVSQFDYIVENDKKERHKSIAENNKSQVNLTKDFQRSKSYDYVRRERDQHLRARQIVSPKINEEVFKFERSNQKSDSNNNSSRKRNQRRRPIPETATVNENKTNLKTSQQVQAPNLATAIQEKNRKDCTEVDKNNISPNENKNGTILSSIKRKPVRSVKSIKKIFEVPEQKPSPKTIKKETLSSVDTIINGGEDNNQNKLDSNKLRTTDKILSQDDQISKNCGLKKNVEDCDKNKNTSEEVTKNLEHVRKNILNDITEEFYKNNSDAESSYSYSEEEFNKIENTLQEMEHTIEQIKMHHSNSNLFNGDGDEAKPQVEYKNEDLEEPENINVYVDKIGREDGSDDEFGTKSIANIESSDFIEAYNREGDELVITSIGAVEHRSLSEIFTSRESLVLNDYSDKIVPNSTASSTNDMTNLRDEDGVIPEENVFDEAPHDLENGVENKLYFSTEEMPDTESEVASNRSTFYLSTTTNSTESMERYSKAESDEGVEFEKETEHIYEEIRLENNVEIRSNSAGGFDRTIKTETYYDSFQNPRIAKVSNFNSEECATKAKSPVVEEAEPFEVAKSPSGLKPKKDYLIEELIDTEKKYIKDLEKVVWDYMPAITDAKLPPSLIGKSRYLFGNIKKIYCTTQKFYKALKCCGNDHEEIAKTFISFKYLFELYPPYSKNKPVAHQYLLGDFKDVVSTREKELNDRLGLASNLLTPIQRLGKYILFLEQIQKELSKNRFISDNVYQAIQVVRTQMSRGNDFIAIDSIKDCPFSLLEQGSFVMSEKFNVIKPRKYETMMFMFEEILVLTTVDPKNQEMFIYRDSIKLNEMGIVTFDDQPLVFHLKRFPSYKKGPKEHNELVIEAKKNKDKKTWTEQIEKRLWEQLVKCKEKQIEMHSDQGKRNSFRDIPDRPKRKKPGYTSLPSEMRKNPPKSIFYYKVDRDA